MSEYDPKYFLDLTGHDILCADVDAITGSVVDGTVHVVVDGTSVVATLPEGESSLIVDLTSVLGQDVVSQLSEMYDIVRTSEIISDTFTSSYCEALVSDPESPFPPVSIVIYSSIWQNIANTVEGFNAYCVEHPIHIDFGIMIENENNWYVTYPISTYQVPLVDGDQNPVTPVSYLGNNTIVSDIDIVDVLRVKYCADPTMALQHYQDCSGGAQ